MLGKLENEEHEDEGESSMTTKHIKLEKLTPDWNGMVRNLTRNETPEKRV